MYQYKHNKTIEQKQEHCAFGESYNDLYPGTIYSPPSYDVRFPSAIMSS